MTNRLNRINPEQRDPNPLNHGDALIRPRRPWDDTLDEITNLLRTLYQDLEQGAGDLCRGQNRASLNNLAASPEVREVREVREAVEVAVALQVDNEIQDGIRSLNDNEIQDVGIGSLDDNGIQDVNGSHNHIEEREDECLCELCKPDAAFWSLPHRLGPSSQPCPCENCMIGPASLVYSQALYDRTPFYLFNFPQEPTMMATTWSSDTDTSRVRKSKIGGFFRNVFSRIKRNTKDSFRPLPAQKPDNRSWWSRVFRRDSSGQP